jgi:uncharacterized membrane protein YcjF (UPF0283 family)
MHLPASGAPTTQASARSLERARQKKQRALSLSSAHHTALLPAHAPAICALLCGRRKRPRSGVMTAVSPSALASLAFPPWHDARQCAAARGARVSQRS